MQLEGTNLRLWGKSDPATRNEGLIDLKTCKIYYQGLIIRIFDTTEVWLQTQYNIQVLLTIVYTIWTGLATVNKLRGTLQIQYT